MPQCSRTYHKWENNIYILEYMLKLKYWLNALAMLSTTLRKQIAKNGRELMRMIRENEMAEEEET